MTCCSLGSTISLVPRRCAPHRLRTVGPPVDATVEPPSPNRSPHPGTASRSSAPTTAPARHDDDEGGGIPRRSAALVAGQDEVRHGNRRRRTAGLQQPAEINPPGEASPRSPTGPPPTRLHVQRPLPHTD